MAVPFASTPRRMEDLALFARHLAGAMNARVPLPDILRAYIEDGEGGPIEKAVSRIVPEIEQGSSLAEAMERHPRAFPAPFRRLVRLGEQGRTLPGLMGQTADRFEQSLKLYEAYRRSATYPLILLMVLMSIVTFITWKIIPTFEGIYEQLGAQLPAGSTSMPHLIVIEVLILVPIVYLAGIVMGLKMFGLGSGRMALQIPLIGPVMRLGETSNFAANLSLLLENRVPLAEALGLLSESSANTYVRDAIDAFRRRYEAGEPLHAMMRDQPLFPPSMAVMIAAAEDHGELAQTLRHLARFYHDRAMHGLAVLRELMEPVMLVLVGVVITLTVVSFYFTLFQIPRFIQ